MVLNINGNKHEVNADAGADLLFVLRNDLDLTGSKYGCDWDCYLINRTYTLIS